jgi:predicted nucleic acid-binding protein
LSDILVDTSVWIDFFRTPDSPYSLFLDFLLEEKRVCTTHLIKAEVVPGAKTVKRYWELMDYFDHLPQVEDPPSMWDDIMRVQFRLKRVGHSASIPDLMIAVIAHNNERTIFTKDSDFKFIQKVLPIPLLELP